MFIDSHCHLDRLKLDVYDGDLDKAVIAARDAGVSKMLCVGIDLANAPKVLALAERYPDVCASVGVHPLDCKDELASKDELISLAGHSEVVAIGETGLDYFYAKESRDLQQASFVMHLKVASECDLPVIVHTRDAREDTLGLMRQHGDLDNAGVLHCFTESWDMAKAAMDMNYYISISGIVTFKNAEALREVVRKMPLDRLLIETDAPYLAPIPHRGKPNEPQYVADVGRFVAGLKNISVETLAEKTTENFYKLFPRAFGEGAS